MTQQAPVLVLGGTGKTSRRVAAELRRRGRTPRVASRSGPQRFDWDDRATWAPALTGAQAVYVVTAGAGRSLPDFGELAFAHGVRRLVLLSARAWQRVGDADLLVSEDDVRRFDGEWTILRPTWFAQNFTEEPFLVEMVRNGTVTLSAGDGLVPFVDTADIAAVAATVLDGGGHAGQVLELSGPRLLSFGAAVAELSSASGRRLTYVPATSARCLERLAELDFPAEFAAFLDRMFGWVAQGHEAHLSDGVEQVLGREPVDFGDYARRAAASIAAGP